MNNFVISQIRTYTPIAAGSIIWFLVSLGIEIGQEATAGLVIFLTAVFQGAYYLVARTLERKYPKAGLLLGIANKPKY